MSGAQQPPSGGSFQPFELHQGSYTGQSTVPIKYDPWGPVSAVLYELGDSDFVQNAVAATGVTIPWRPLSRDEAYSHGTRIRAFRRDISAAYQNLAQEQRGLFAQIVVKAMLRRHNSAKLRAELLDRLADIDWIISPDGTLTTNDALISEQFFPANSEYDAYVTVRDIFASATSQIEIVDAYLGSSLFATLRVVARPNLSVRALTTTRGLKADFIVEMNAFKAQLSHIQLEIRTAADFHDRFIAIDDTAFYHVGASIKDAGRRAFMISRIEDQTNVESVRRAVALAWSNGAPFQP